MRILHILPSADQRYGGPIRAVVDLSAHAANFGLRSDILAFGNLDLPDNPLNDGAIHVLPTTFPHNYCYCSSFDQWSRENLKRFDGVVLHGMWLYPNWAAADACIRAGIPYACFPHGMLDRWAVYLQGVPKAIKKLLYWQLREKRIFEQSRCVFFASERERQRARSTFPLGGTQLIVMPYGAFTSPAAVSEPARADLMQPPDRKIALFLGRLHPKKNLQLLIEAWRLSGIAHPWHLVIAGSGEPSYTARLKRMIEESGLGERVHLIGFVAGQDKEYLLQRASWFLLPSKQENFGNAVVEAISRGCAVAISDQVFIGDCLCSGSDILPVDTEAWAVFIRTRMRNARWQAESSALNRERLARIMNIEKVARGWTEVLTNVFQS